MPDKTSRALRRYHRARLLKRAIQKSKEWYCWSNPDPDYIMWRAYRTWNNMTPCSCHRCGNQRHNAFLHKYERLTLQERKALQSFEQQMEEVDNLEDLRDNSKS